MDNQTKCIKCGLCRGDCPVFKAELNEAESPRGRAIQAVGIGCANPHSNEEFNSLYKCLGCKACTENCPVKFDLKIEDIREKMVERGFETETNKKMVENVRQFGNPFGKIDENFVPVELHCC